MKLTAETIATCAAILALHAASSDQARRERHESIRAANRQCLNAPVEGREL